MISGRGPMRAASRPNRRASTSTTSGPGAMATPALTTSQLPHRREERDVGEEHRRERQAEHRRGQVAPAEAGDPEQRQVERRRRPGVASARRTAPSARARRRWRRSCGRRPSPTCRSARGPARRRRRRGRAAPSRRGRGTGRGRPRATRRGSAARRRCATTQTGRLTKNTQRQPAQSTSRPPIVGPKAAATAPIEPHTATAIGTRSFGVARSTRASDVGVIAAAPTAWTTRAAIRNPARRGQTAQPPRRW